MDAHIAHPGEIETAPRRLLGTLFNDAVASVRGETLVQRNSRLDGGSWTCRSPHGAVEWDLPANGRVIVIGAGKATASLAKGIEAQFGTRIDDGIIIVKYGHTEPLHRIRQVEAGHPVPDDQGIEGTRQILQMLDGLRPQDRVFVLITGGASSLMVAPAQGISLADKAAVTGLLLRSAASIEEINAIRAALSQVKGGRLLGRIAPAQSMTLLISDIPSGDIGKIGSGPTIPRSAPVGSPLEILGRYGLLEESPASVIRHLESPTSATALAVPAARAEAILLADSTSLVEAVEAGAASRALQVRRVDVAMQGGTHAAAHAFTAAMKEHVRTGAPRPCLFVSSGETTLQVQGTGQGGRNQEFALTAAVDLAGIEGCTLLAAGTDGTDGPTPAAGGFADWTTCARAEAKGFSVRQTLADNNSYHLLKGIGDLHMTGATGTNVMDLVLGLVS